MTRLNNFFKYQICILLILNMLFFQGCILLLPVAAVGAVQLVRKAASGPAGRSEKERLAIEYREFKCSKDEMIVSLRSVLAERNLKITKDDSENKTINSQRNPSQNGGIVGGSPKVTHEKTQNGTIEASTDSLSLNLKITYSEKPIGTVGVRLVVSNDKGIIENNTYYEDFFEDLGKTLKVSSYSK